MDNDVGVKVAQLEEELGNLRRLETRISQSMSDNGISGPIGSLGDNQCSGSSAVELIQRWHRELNNAGVCVKVLISRTERHLRKVKEELSHKG